MKKRSWLTSKIQNWLLPEIIEQTNKEFERVRESQKNFGESVRENFERYQEVIGKEVTLLKQEDSRIADTLRFNLLSVHEIIDNFKKEVSDSEEMNRKLTQSGFAEVKEWFDNSDKHFNERMEQINERLEKGSQLFEQLQKKTKRL